MIEVIPAHEADQAALRDWLIELAANLRPADLDEIEATSEEPPLASLLSSLLASDMAWVGLRGGTPVCIFGVAPTPLPGAGNVWMMGTPEIDEIPVAFLRRTGPYLRQMHERYPLLWNYIDARNRKSMDWLDWSGFRLLEAHPHYGREGRLFFTFARYEPHV